MWKFSLRRTIVNQRNYTVTRQISVLENEYNYLSIFYSYPIKNFFVLISVLYKADSLIAYGCGICFYIILEITWDKTTKYFIEAFFLKLDFSISHVIFHLSSSEFGLFAVI